MQCNKAIAEAPSFLFIIIAAIIIIWEYWELVVNGFLKYERIKRKLAQQQVRGLHCVVGKKAQLVEVSSGNGRRLKVALHASEVSSSLAHTQSNEYYERYKTYKLI